jgi:twitching motility two-component system response regulator PilH
MANILIVDDSPTEIHVLTTILEKNGFSVSVANNGEEGVDKAKAEKPDLILMDVVMPETNNIPIIIVSTKDQETDKMWGLRQGAKDYVTKPAQEKDLISKINSLLGA